jgi:hypothetical protein
MAIDMYAEWPGMTNANEEVSIPGFSAVHCHAGYLREAHHGARRMSSCPSSAG